MVKAYVSCKAKKSDPATCKPDTVKAETRQWMEMVNVVKLHNIVNYCYLVFGMTLT